MLAYIVSIFSRFGAFMCVPNEFAGYQNVRFRRILDFSREHVVSASQLNGQL